MALRGVGNKPVQTPALPKKEDSPYIETIKVRGGIQRREPRRDAVRVDTIQLTGEIAALVAEVGKVYSPNVIMRASTEKFVSARVPSGILSLDLCLAGGIMCSRGSMFYGKKSAGKSTLAARFIASVQRVQPDGFAIYVDIEGTCDLPWMQNQGVDLDRMLIIEPENAEMAVDMADGFLHAKEVSMLVSDSIAMLMPAQELAASSEDRFMGTQARLVSNYLKKINAGLISERHRSHFPVILHINQFRTQFTGFGDPRILPGGNALEYCTTQQIEIMNHEKTNKEKDNGSSSTEDKEDKQTKVVFNEHNFKITKDKSGGRFKEGRFVLVRDESTGLPVGYINQSRTIINFGLTTGILQGSKQSFSIDGSNFSGKFAGAPEFVKYLVEHQSEERAIVNRIVEYYRKKWNVT